MVLPCRTVDRKWDRHLDRTHYIMPYTVILFIVQLFIAVKVQGSDLLYAADVINNDILHDLSGSAKLVLKNAQKPQAIDMPNPPDAVKGKVKYLCPDGYNLKLNTCIKVEIRDPMPSCPYGAYRDKTGDCVVVDSVPPEKSCPPTFEWYRKGCIRRELKDPIFMCPPGFMIFDDFCAMSRDLSPDLVCPPDFRVDDGQGKCVHDVIQQPKYECPYEYVLILDKKECIKNTESPISYFCDSGYTLIMDSESQGYVCEKYEAIVGVSECPIAGHATYVTAYEGVCEGEIELDPVVECEDGAVYNESSKTCIRIETAEGLNYCGDDNGARIDKSGRGILKQVNGSNCGKNIRSFQENQIIPNTVTYQEGYGLDEAGSKYTVTSYSATTRNDLPCPEGYTLLTDKKHKHYNICTRQETRNAKYKCLEGQLSRDLKCIKRISDAAKHTFHLGTYHQTSVCSGELTYTAENKPVCTQRIVENPKMLCGGNPTNNSHCVKSTTTNPIIKCSDGFHSSNGICKRSTMKAATLICPDGEPPNAFNKCKTFFTAPKEVSCPDDFKHGGYDKNLSGLCERVVYANHQEVCPEGYERDKNHAKDNNKACIAHKLVPPIMMCEPGFLSDGDKCVKRVKMSPSLKQNNGNISACRLDSKGHPSCAIETKYYAKVTDQGERKGEKRLKKLT